MEDVQNKIFYDSAHGAVWITTNYTNLYIDEDVKYEVEDEDEEEDNEEMKEKSIINRRNDIHFTLNDLLPSLVNGEDVKYEEESVISSISSLREKNTITLTSLLSSSQKCTERIPELEIKQNINNSELEEVIEIDSESEEYLDTLSYYEVLESNSESENEVSILNEPEEEVTIYIESEEENNLDKEDLVNVKRHEKKVDVENDYILKALRDFPRNTCTTSKSRKKSPLKNKTMNIHLKNSPKKSPKYSNHKKISSHFSIKPRLPPTKKKSRHSKKPSLSRRINISDNRRLKEKARRDELGELFSILASEVPSIGNFRFPGKNTILKEAVAFIKELTIEEKYLSKEIFNLESYNRILRKQLGV